MNIRSRLRRSFQPLHLPRRVSRLSPGGGPLLLHLRNTVDGGLWGRSGGIYPVINFVLFHFHSFDCNHSFGINEGYSRKEGGEGGEGGVSASYILPSISKGDSLMCKQVVRVKWVCRCRFTRVLQNTCRRECGVVW